MGAESVLCIGLVYLTGPLTVTALVVALVTTSAVHPFMVWVQSIDEDLPYVFMQSLMLDDYYVPHSRVNDRHGMRGRTPVRPRSSITRDAPGLTKKAAARLAGRFAEKQDWSWISSRSA